MTKLLNTRKSLPPANINVYRNEEYEKANMNGKLEKYKVLDFVNIINNL